MASYTRDKKTGKPVLQSQIKTPYQPDELTADRAPAAVEEPAKKESKE
ncbi:hypothetical protein [Devosia sp.]|nr:hypothetical protein [Devosia sp.]MBN9335626.1 hypothetical protein [Devosia sp.]